MDRLKILQWVNGRLKARGLSVAKAEKLAGCRDAIRNLKRGRSLPKVGALWALADVLGEPPPGLFDAPRASPVALTLDEAKDLLAEMEQQVEDMKAAIRILERRKVS